MARVRGGGSRGRAGDRDDAGGRREVREWSRGAPRRRGAARRRSGSGRHGCCCCRCRRRSERLEFTYVSLHKAGGAAAGSRGVPRGQDGAQVGAGRQDQGLEERNVLLFSHAFIGFRNER